MALRARIAPTQPEPAHTWPWHKAKWSIVRVSQIIHGDRRMEAETYLSSGYGIRVAIESKPEGWQRLGSLAHVWMPGRLKGVQVEPEYGAPFLAATAVYAARPIPRKWLSIEQTPDAENRFVSPGMILVTCSGTVGRPTLATDVHKGCLISHDLLRVGPRNDRDAGWLYAYLHSPQTRAMTVGAHYGQIIKHLETGHLDALPVPMVDATTKSHFAARMNRILSLRNESHRLTLEADRMFEQALGPVDIEDTGENGFSIHAAPLFSSRRRLDAAYHNPVASAIRRHLRKNGAGFTTIEAAGYEVWLPARFKRVPAEDGVAFRDSSSLTEVNPQTPKRIADGDFGDPYRGRVEPGWVLMARSGQVYGIIGTPVLASDAMRGYIISDHVMRFRPLESADIEAGYLVVALSHPTLGRPLVKALASGSSVPEIDVADMQAFSVVRLPNDVEAEIARLVEASAQARADADELEREIARDAGKIIDRFIDKPVLRLVVTDLTAEEEEAAERFRTLAEQWRAERPPGANVGAMIDHPAYRSVIDLGEMAIRPILEDLMREPDHWFPALNAIAGANPVPIGHEGRLKLMAEDWIAWGRAEGYLS